MFSNKVSNSSKAINGAQHMAFTKRQIKNRFRNFFAFATFVLGVKASNEKTISSADIIKLIKPITPSTILQ